MVKIVYCHVVLGFISFPINNVGKFSNMFTSLLALENCFMKEAIPSPFWLGAVVNMCL